METILDANVLFRILISQGDIIDLIFNDSLILLAPDKLKEEFLNHKEEILNKSCLSESEFTELTSNIFEKIIFIPLNEYKISLPKAKLLLGRHEKDEDFVALALSKNCKIWTYESLIFKIDLGISTKQISELLSKEKILS